MDTRHFDSLTKQLAQTPSRRHMLQVLAAALSVGSVAALGRANSAEARGGSGLCVGPVSCTHSGDCCPHFKCDFGTGIGTCVERVRLIHPH